MSLMDLVVLSALAVLAGYPLAKSAFATVRLRAFARASAAETDGVAKWRQKWTASLITLGTEIEAGNGGQLRKEEALKLSKELMWEIIGGEVPPTAV